MQPLVRKVTFVVAARPRCTICERELIHTAIVVNDKMFMVWICDCEGQPEGISTHIVNAREWDDATLIID